MNCLARFGVGGLQGELVALRGQMLGEDG